MASHQFRMFFGGKMNIHGLLLTTKTPDYYKMRQIFDTRIASLLD